jgi:excisionase family DNA binding protein
MDKLCVNVVEAAKLLGIGKSALYELIRKGEVPYLRIGVKRVVIPIDALRNWITTRTHVA